MVKILLGKNGSGKSTEIIEMIKRDCENGTRSLLIVPEQKTVLCERDLAKKLPPSAQLYTEALNFTRLCDKVFRNEGGLKYNYISQSGKNLIMYRAICEVRDFLTEYKIKKGHERGTVKLFLSAIGELKSYAVSAEDMKKATQGSKNSPLTRRINDLVLVMNTYERLLNEKFSDPYDDMIMLERTLAQSDILNGVNVYIDSFDGFTGSQIAVLSRIIENAQNVVIAIDCPKENIGGGMQYEKLSETVKKIDTLCRKKNKECEKEFFEKDLFRKKEGVKYLFNNIWNFSAEKSKNHDGVELWRCGDEFDECSFVASRICELVREGNRYSDIAVISANSDTYRGTIDFSFDKYGIPYYFAQKTDIYSKPLVKMIFSALEAVNSYRAKDIISYAKCGFTDILLEDADTLGEYMYRWNIYGKKKFTDDSFWASNPDGYVSNPTITQMETLAKINDTRNSIIEKLQILKKPFENGGKFSDCAKGVYDFLEAHSIKDKLSNMIKEADRDEAIELSQLYSAIMHALDTVVSAMGDTEVDITSFATVLKYALDGIKIGTIPTGEDNVIIGSAGELRTSNIKYVFVLGVNEGVFPRQILDDGFFSDTDKIALETMGIILSEKTDIRADNALLDFANSVGVASDLVCVTAQKNTVFGAKKEPSIAFTRIAELFENIEINDTSSLPAYFGIYTEQTAREHKGTIGIVSDAVCEILGEEKTKDDFANDNLKIDEKTAKEIFGDKLSLSQSKIETFVKCHFKYYCSYLLKLKSSEKISFSSRDIGFLTHSIFEIFLSKAKDEKIDFSAISDEEIEKMVDQIIEEYIKMISSSGVKTNRLTHLFARLRSNILCFVKNIAKEMAQCDFEAEYFELPFNFGDGDKTPPPLKFKIGENSEISLRGVCDRVDILRKNGNTYIRIVDYKTGSKKFLRSDISTGLGLQMLIYLFTLLKMDEGDFRKNLLKDTENIVPAGIMYIPFKIGKALSKTETDIYSCDIEKEESDIVQNEIERSGLFLKDTEILTAQDKNLNGEFLPKYSDRSKSFIPLEEFEEIYKEMEQTLDTIGSAILSGDASAIPLRDDPMNSVCDYCENRAVCRRRKKRV